MLLLLNVSMVIGLIIFCGKCEKEIFLNILYLKRVKVDYFFCLFFYFIEELVSCFCLYLWSW